MDLQLNGKVALVTGGSLGIGKGIARVLAREGVDVAICARRKDVLEAAADEIRRESGRKVLAIPADLTRREDAENFVRGAARHFGNGGGVRQTIIEMESGFLLTSAAGSGTCLAVIAEQAADLGLVAYEMAILVRRTGEHIRVNTRASALSGWG